MSEAQTRLDAAGLAERFTSLTLPKDEWTHTAHLVVGAWHVDRYGAAEALTRLRTGIRTLNESHDNANTATTGYHETITVAYVTLLAEFLASCPAGMSIDARVVRLLTSPLADRDILLKAYSRERLMSIAARTAWVEPDRAPLRLAAITGMGQGPEPAPPLDACASDPLAMRWMVGNPPPTDRLVLFSDASFYTFPRTRWAFSHMRELVPTVAVPRGTAPVWSLPRAERRDLDAVTFTPIGGSAPMTWAQSLDANYTDGLLILHRGRVVYERYFGALTAERPHIAFSVTKSFVATLAGLLIADGTLDDRATGGQYVPELQPSAFGDATVRQLLDMTTGLDYSENYADEHSPVWSLGRAVGFLPRAPGYSGASTAYEYLASLRKSGSHGERFVYKTPNTDALAWVLRRVSGKPLHQLLAERLFSKLGAEQDGYFLVDPTGVEFAGGGLHLSLRDLARFGELIRLDGRLNGESIVPKAFIDDVRRGGDQETFAGAGYKTLPGGSYRSMWWVLHNAHGAYAARGIHGQAIYIDPVAEMVIARFASHPLGANVNLDPTSLPAFDAVGRYLVQHS